MIVNVPLEQSGIKATFKLTTLCVVNCNLSGIASVNIPISYDYEGGTEFALRTESILSNNFNSDNYLSTTSTANLPLVSTKVTSINFVVNVAGSNINSISRIRITTFSLNGISGNADFLNKISSNQWSTKFDLSTTLGQDNSCQLIYVIEIS